MTDRFDLKLFLLLLFRRFYLLLVGAVAGALLVGGVYVFIQLVVKDTLYESRVVAHQELHYNDKTGQYTYLNGYTWNEVMSMDWITEAVSDNLSGSVSADEIRGYIRAEMPSDTRIVYIFVTTASYEKTAKVFDALIPVIMEIPDHLGEIDEMLIMDRDETPVRVNNIKQIVRALALGAVLGLFTALFIMSVSIIIDDSAYIPKLTEDKYGIPCEVVSGEIPKGALVIEKKIPDLSAVSGSEIELYLKAGARNGRIMDFVLSELKKKQVFVSKIIIVEPVNWLIKGFYAGTAFPNPFMK